MDELVFGEIRILVTSNALPHLFGEYSRRALLSEAFDMNQMGGAVCWLGVSRGTDWPFLSIAQRYKAPGPRFEPGALFVSKTETLFIGAGRRLLAYNLQAPSRIWEEQTEAGFHSWSRHGDVVLMAGEQELAAWDLEARSLWRVPLEKGDSYKVAEERIVISGENPQDFALDKGPVGISR